MTTTGTILRSGALFATCALGLAISPSANARELSMDERIAAQSAIESVYWSHRIWPAENPGPKPPLQAVLPEGAIRAKVERELRLSALLDQRWHEPLTGDALQAEIERMVRDTRTPGTLRELFAALHDDPDVIAECLARPSLAQRRVASLEPRAAHLAGFGSSASLDGERSIAPPAQGYVVPTLPAGGCLDDTWATSSLTDGSGFNVPSARQLHTAVWTGSEMIVWGGWDGVSAAYSTGGSYNPATDTWSQNSLTDGSGSSVPSARYGHTAVWTGTEMIVWGGVNAAHTVLRDGGRYNPAGDSWLACSLTDASGANVPPARELHTAVWTGTEMIVWGGTTGASSSASSTGGRYAPGTDTWATSKLTDGSGFYVPSARSNHTAVWASPYMVIWGGLDSSGASLNTGGGYNAATDEWVLSSLSNATGAYVPAARNLHTAVWTGTEMIIWGGAPSGSGAGLNNGGRYNPVSDTWKSSILVNASGAYVPAGRQRHTAVWTGSEMIVWGGSTNGNTGGRYDPVLDTWASSSLTNATGAYIPSARQLHTAIWTNSSDSRMIVWGGSPNTATGGLYCAVCTPKTWYQDADGDGYGNATATQSGCTRPAGYVGDATDCNDGNPAIHPGATELCDGLDDNCDTVIDEGGAAMCTDNDACTTDVCGGALLCLATHKSSDMNTSGFSSGRVDGRDLEVLAAAWTSTTGGPADLDQSGTVDDVDFHLFMTAFGRSCP